MNKPLDDYLTQEQIEDHCSFMDEVYRAEVNKAIRMIRVYVELSRASADVKVENN